ncbi:uncharacterized protein V1510DRAFT_397718 [Dipodascopsis tothii]|uniref:uncharacterized protein n=1 Tax=Dipodascopsis tothii TaxID=44089 RepID=UPI0034CDE391
MSVSYGKSGLESEAAPDTAKKKPAEDRVIRPRKSHIKSRSGCANCKRRRIKCDEQHPRCRNCIKHGVGCDYLNLPSASAPAATGPGPSPPPWDAGFLGKLPDAGARSGVSPTSPALSPGSLPLLMGMQGQQTHALDHLVAVSPVPRAPQSTASTASPASAPDVVIESSASALSLVQLELFHHFLTVTVKTLSDATDGELWLVQIPRMAFHSEFLMYAILTIAATHLRFLRDDSAYRRMEIYYRQRALETFREALCAPHTPEMLPPLTVAGSLLAMQSFAYRESDEADASVIVSIDRWLPLLLGIRTVVEEMYAANSGADADSIFGINIGSLPEPSDEENELQHLAELCAARLGAYTPGAAEGPDPAELAVYIDPLRLLNRLIKSLRSHPSGDEMRKYVFTWPFLCSADFLGRLRGRDHVALVLFAHFLTVVSMLKAWWQEDRVRADIAAICDYLRAADEGHGDLTWAPWLDWVAKNLPFPLWERSYELDPRARA